MKIWLKIEVTFVRLFTQAVAVCYVIATETAGRHTCLFCFPSFHSGLILTEKSCLRRRRTLLQQHAVSRHKAYAMQPPAVCHTYRSATYGDVKPVLYCFYVGYNLQCIQRCCRCTSAVDTVIGRATVIGT